MDLGKEELLDAVLSVGNEAIARYLEIAGDAHVWDTPEFWLQSEIANALAKAHFVRLEHRVSDTLHYASDGVSDSPEREVERQTGRVDIALYEKVPNPNDASLNAIIEVKKIVNDWCLNADAARILAISKSCGDHVRGIVGGLYFAKSQDQMNALFHEITNRLREIQVSPSMLIKASPATVDARGFHSGFVAAQIC